MPTSQTDNPRNLLRTIKSFLNIQPVTLTNFAALSTTDRLMHSTLSSWSALT